MKVDLKKPSRKYQVGFNQEIIIEDCGTINLDYNQQITFITDDKKEYDLCRKSWGFYATPSVNSRLVSFNFKTALVQNSKKQIYVMIVEREKIDDFFLYLKKEKNYLLEWLDER
tara:strand:+ start:84 stop:425 length:342 start_codon:yes stop_codon:yes gene_type:complete